MKFTAFKVGDGDRLLIEGKNANILVDGGRKGGFKASALPTLGQMAADGKTLDLVCVSHIDEDHITGVVDLIDRRRSWAIFDFQNDEPGGAQIDEPEQPRVPRIRQLWHNSFGETFKDASTKVTNALGFHSQLLEASSTLKDTTYGSQFGRLAQGAKRAIELELMLSHSPMGITFNGPSTAAVGEPRLLRLQTPPQTAAVNGVTVHLVGQTQKNFDDSFKDWNTWVKKNGEKIEDMKKEFQREFPTGNALDFLAFSVKQA
ncbi:MAG: MBL fold metallo-hydrolase, partial [Myxococcota bacterium]